MRAILSVVAMVVVSATLVGGQTTPSAADVARQIQAHYDTVKDFEAGFTSVYRGGFSRALPKEQGTIKVKKPGRMKWTFERPERREFWSDGTNVYMYLPVSKQGSISPLSGEDSTSLLFLMDRGNLTRDFTASLPGAQPDTEWRLTLVPKRPDPDLQSLVLIVDRATLRLRGFEKRDDQGGTTTIQFQNFKENVGLRDEEFVKNPPFPKGTERIK